MTLDSKAPPGAQPHLRLAPEFFQAYKNPLPRGHLEEAKGGCLSFQLLSEESKKELVKNRRVLKTTV